MAVIMVTTPFVYTGLSTDTKPTTGVPVGSIFYEFTAGDPITVREFRYNGTAWGLVTTTAAT